MMAKSNQRGIAERPSPNHNTSLTSAQQVSVQRQYVIGNLQTILLIIVVLQSLFAGFLRALPPDLRASLGFLHRIEWGAYVGIALVAAQIIVGWISQTVLTNRFYLLAWRFGNMRIVIDSRARRLQIAYLLLIALMVGAVIWVRINGFIVQPTR
ncbi:MAG: hypothetical protein IT324_21380 [Anaerolineae bacterium]|nr:hypothetical protein [Anaerolineae bacterium]